jgi:hypothetical protein
MGQRQAIGNIPQNGSGETVHFWFRNILQNLSYLVRIRDNVLMVLARQRHFWFRNILARAEVARGKLKPSMHSHLATREHEHDHFKLPI